MPKAYLWDWSLGRTAPPASRTSWARTCSSSRHYLQDVEGFAVELHYLRDREGREVDFLVTSGANSPGSRSR